jgi:hypothetical protein
MRPYRIFNGHQSGQRDCAARFMISCSEEGLLRGFAHRAHAACADVEALHFAVDHDVLLVHIRPEVAIGPSLRKADVMPE